MNPSSRRLTFVVGTSLLTASLATGCKKTEPTANPGPEPVHVNTVPSEEPAAEEPAPDADVDAGTTDAPSDEPNVNTVPDA